MDKLLDHLRSCDHRVLIFSQMTRMLDIIQDYLGYRGMSNDHNAFKCMYTASMCVYTSICTHNVMLVVYVCVYISNSLHVCMYVYLCT